MSLKSREDPALKPKELVFLLAIAGRIDAQGRLLAQKLDKDRYIYHAYAVLDSLSSSYSMFKYFFEVFISSSDADLMHQILTSPEGIAAITGEALFLVSFSFLASLYDKEKKDSVKKFIATAWPYFRDVIKGLKNAYKGWRSAIQVLSVLSSMDLRYMIVPVGLALGIFATANRLWLRGMLERRKKQMNINKELLLEIQQLSSLTAIDRHYYSSRIKYQNEEERIHSFLAVSVGGIIDGLYLYVGVLGLSILSPPLFIAMSAISAVYILACVISRIYEEYDFQLRLLITQTKCKLALVTKEMETTYANLLSLQEKRNKSFKDWEEIKHLKLEVCGLIHNLIELQQVLRTQSNHNYLTAGLVGMKSGLFAYGVVTSFLFMVASVFLVTATVFPPALLAAFIISGLLLMIGMTAYTMRSHYLRLQKQEGDKTLPYSQLIEMKKNIETHDDAEILPADIFVTSLKNGVFLDPSPQYFFQEWFEVFRSIASGLSKGSNFSNFATTSLQEVDSDGSYHDTPVTGVLAMASAVLFSIVLGLRALARGLGRPSSGQVNLTSTSKTAIRKSPTDKMKTEPLGESSEAIKKKSPSSLPRNNPLSRNRFFAPSHRPSSPDRRLLPHSKSENALNQMTSSINLNSTAEFRINGNIILGLE